MLVSGHLQRGQCADMYGQARLLLNAIQRALPGDRLAWTLERTAPQRDKPLRSEVIADILRIDPAFAKPLARGNRMGLPGVEQWFDFRCL